MNEEKTVRRKQYIPYHRSIPSYMESLQQEDFIHVGGMANLWFSWDVKWTLPQKIEATGPDIMISTKHIVLYIHTYPPQAFEISAPVHEIPSESESVRQFIESLEKFVAKKGYQFKAIQNAGRYLTLPDLASEQTETFDGLITHIENNIAFVTLVDDAGKESYMEIPCEDLQKDSIECKPGMMFSMEILYQGDWEKIRFLPIERPPMTKDEKAKLLDYYEQKYGDL